ncbi:hypothetical protein WR25_26356 [Diploscapter pachys]|uniref:C2H2-type domain-containing protein n=1 Tax=Diploscapter pachys TaxID=2018661 RepID=A0A2A2JJV0_9BILA|nr:hypothetical protein WR25_26356 [Diploscapter pachys]
MQLSSFAPTTTASSSDNSSVNQQAFISALDALQQQHAAAQALQQQPLMQKMLMSGGTSVSSSRGLGGIEGIAARLSNKQSNGNVVNVSSGSQSSAESTNMNGASDSQPVNISNQTPGLLLCCTQCNLEKNNAEEMEIHIKTEHLNWQPFQCPICLHERASDAQMREHLHSAHRKNMNKFIYVDNLNAKRLLTTMMDKALAAGMKKKLQKTSTSSSLNSGANLATSIQNPPKLTPMITVDATKEKSTDDSNVSVSQANLNAMMKMMTSVAALNGIKEKNTIESKTDSTPLNGRKRSAVDFPATNTDSLLASISRATGDADSNGGPEENDPFSMFSMKRVKTENMGIDENDDDDDVLNGVNPIAVLDNVAALFGTGDGRLLDSDYGSTPPLLDKHGKNGNNSNSLKFGGSVAKKRVLGECSKCQKPVTAGARQMHMFFHLAKDENTYRFRCLFPDCTVEHYRKDQMENHQSKVHGKIDPEKMIDRSIELFGKCQELSRELFVYRRNNATSNFDYDDQELSMELLGTKNGSIPGPTAAKAEIAYAAQLAAAANKEKGRSDRNRLNRPVQEEEHPLECRICHKTMQNRIRGFHILWHLAKDMGINRYTCKFCGFGHDRSQSVQTHGKKEHSTEDCVEDRIHEYSDDVKKMSEMCFGFQALFAQDTKRRSKIPMATTPMNKNGASPNASDSGDGTVDDDGLTTPKEEIIDESSIFKHDDDDEGEGEGDDDPENDDDVKDDVSLEKEDIAQNKNLTEAFLTNIMKALAKQQKTT